MQNSDLRGKMHRNSRQMSDEAAREFLRRQRTAHVGTVDAHGWPYVVPLVLVYEGSDILYLHTGGHHGHFFYNLAANPRLCVEVSDTGSLVPVDSHACDSALIYSSVIVYGTARVIEDNAKKEWFFDRLLERFAEPGMKFKPGYPALDRIILFEVAIETLTGKRSPGMGH
jgi:uncharacterized protein